MKKYILLLFSIFVFAGIASARPCRVIYRLDNSVVVIHPAPNARRKNETDQDFINRIYQEAVKNTGLKGLPYENMDTSELPDRQYRDKWRKGKTGGVIIDHSITTKQEKKQQIENELDTELNKESPDPIKILKLQRRLDKKEY